MKFYHTSSLYFLSPCLPQHGEKFCTKKRRIVFGPLGVIILCPLPVVEPEYPGHDVGEDEHGEQPDHRQGTHHLHPKTKLKDITREEG